MPRFFAKRRSSESGNAKKAEGIGSPKPDLHTNEEIFRQSDDDNDNEDDDGGDDDDDDDQDDNKDDNEMVSMRPMG